MKTNASTLQSKIPMGSGSKAPATQSQGTGPATGNGAPRGFGGSTAHSSTINAIGGPLGAAQQTQGKGVTGFGSALKNGLV